MTITIRDKHTVELIRRIGSKTGEGPAEIVRRLAEREIAGQAVPISEEKARRTDAIMRITSKYAPIPAPSTLDVMRDIDEINRVD